MPNYATPGGIWQGDLTRSCAHDVVAVTVGGALITRAARLQVIALASGRDIRDAVLFAQQHVPCASIASPVLQLPPPLRLSRVRLVLAEAWMVTKTKSWPWHCLRCAGCEWAVCSNGRHVTRVNHDGAPAAEPDTVSSASMDPARQPAAHLEMCVLSNGTRSASRGG